MSSLAATVLEHRIDSIDLDDSEQSFFDLLDDINRLPAAQAAPLFFRLLHVYHERVSNDR